MTLVAITGASRGIGRATAFALAQRRCRLAVFGRPGQALDDVVAALDNAAPQVRGYACDLADPIHLEQAAGRLLAELGAPDCVIHNAGVLRRGPVQHFSLEDFDHLLAINLRAPFVLTRATLPAMLARRCGRHLYVSSISATVGTANHAAYNATKWALNGFVKSLAQELVDTGLMALAVLPGSVNTEMLAQTAFQPRMTPAEVAATLVHYALDAPLAHNGSLIEMFGV